MIRLNTLKDFEINRNTVLFHYACPLPPDGERPYECCIKYLGWFISASRFNHYFQVYKGCDSKIFKFSTLKEAKNFIKYKFDNVLNFDV